MKNLKDKITTICGILILLTGTILTVEKSGIVLPLWLTNASTAIGIIAASVLAYYTGKNPDGSTKTELQINAQQKPVETTQQIVDASKN